MREIHPIIREVLKKRGITEESEILEFLSEKPKLTYNPFLMKDLEAGVDLILLSIKQNRKICIYGDYDADGVTSISLLFQVLSQLTKNLTYYIPSRFDEGYGLNRDAIDILKGMGTDLIITVDCGSASREEVDYGKSIGIDFIVTDHHNIDDAPSDCILINPKQADCPYPFKHLAGCGVAFKLAQGIQRKAGLPKSILTEVLDLVAIATIGDIVPLIGENRTLVKHGMEIIDLRKRPGLNFLMESIGLISGKIKSENIAYIIVPHLNAAGRLLDAKIGVELLTSKDDKVLSDNVDVLIQNNNDRKKIQEEAFQKCKKIIDNELQGDMFYIIASQDIHEGIAGIVAGKIKEEYGRPTIIVTPSGGEGLLKGTGRSITNLNLYNVLKKHENLFIKFGGHSGACGFSMKEENLDALRTRLNLELEIELQDNPNLFDSNLLVEVEIEQEDIDIELVLELEKLAPFGCKNERPLFQMNEIKPDRLVLMGTNSQHVRFSAIGKQGIYTDCILFQRAQEFKELLLRGETLKLAGYPDINDWKGSRKIQFVIREISC